MAFYGLFMPYGSYNNNIHWMTSLFGSVHGWD